MKSHSLSFFTFLLLDIFNLIRSLFILQWLKLHKIVNQIKPCVTFFFTADYVLSVCPCKTNSNTMTQYEPMSHKKLQDIIQQLKSSSCCLDILPAEFFKSFRLHDSTSAPDCQHGSPLRCLPTSHENCSY